MTWRHSKVIFSILITTGIFNLGNTQNSLKYRILIRDAIISICDSNYQNASRLYNEAFNLGVYAEAKDIHNAIICAILKGDIKTSVNLSAKLIEYGADSTFFYSNADYKTTVPYYFSK